ncbi:hypothetical protein MUK42_13072 [Musa troglodytarum]|uniref:Uncharacterized protein n=1 Tax=Musa troglodytarum TaxID=320322 RepID=A0A9E7KHG5_9LILI|nr:hypothetical protein MUK42_13072 [Musa troglodytarum]
MLTSLSLECHTSLANLVKLLLQLKSQEFLMGRLEEAAAVEEKPDEACRTPRTAECRISEAPTRPPPPPPRKPRMEPCSAPPEAFFSSPDMEAFFAALSSQQRRMPS